jgi:hypothetical protein
LVWDAEALGIYSVRSAPSDRQDQPGDILKTINLDNIRHQARTTHRSRPEKTGDVLRLDIAIDSRFPERSHDTRRSNLSEQVDAARADHADVRWAVPIGDGVNHNDKNYLTQFPVVALAGLNEGHGAPAP